MIAEAGEFISRAFLAVFVWTPGAAYEISMDETLDLASKDIIFFHQTGHDATFHLNNKYFWCDMYQTGSLTLTGSCDQINLALTSYGFYYGQELDCKIANVTNEGEGDLFVHATDTLTATIKRVGNIYYSGNPNQLNLQDFGEGEIVKQ